MYGNLVGRINRNCSKSKSGFVVCCRIFGWLCIVFALVENTALAQIVDPEPIQRYTDPWAYAELMAGESVTVIDVQPVDTIFYEKQWGFRYTNDSRISDVYYGMYYGDEAFEGGIPQFNAVQYEVLPHSSHHNTFLLGGDVVTAPGLNDQWFMDTFQYGFAAGRINIVENPWHQENYGAQAIFSFPSNDYIMASLNSYIDQFGESSGEKVYSKVYNFGFLPQSDLYDGGYSMGTNFNILSNLYTRRGNTFLGIEDSQINQTRDIDYQGPSHSFMEGNLISPLQNFSTRFVDVDGITEENGGGMVYEIAYYELCSGLGYTVEQWQNGNYTYDTYDVLWYPHITYLIENNLASPDVNMNFYQRRFVGFVDGPTGTITKAATITNNISIKVKEKNEENEKLNWSQTKPRSRFSSTGIQSTNFPRFWSN